MARPHRLCPASYLGVRTYFLTICSHARSMPFTDATIVAGTRDDFLRAAETELQEILVYCFMPDHLHLVVTGTSETSDLTRFVHLAKQRSGYRFTRTSRMRLWQDSYFEHVLRNVDVETRVIRYVMDNPIRAGLVTSPADYPHWGSQRYSRETLLDSVTNAPWDRRV
jgi:putative transposase